MRPYDPAGQPPTIHGAAKQFQRVARNGRLSDFRGSEITCQSNRAVFSRGFLPESIDALQIKHGPGRLETVEPPLDLRILEKAWSDHGSVNRVRRLIRKRRRLQPFLQLRPAAPAGDAAHGDGDSFLLADQDDETFATGDAGIKQVALEHGVVLG